MPAARIDAFAKHPPALNVQASALSGRIVPKYWLRFPQEIKQLSLALSRCYSFAQCGKTAIRFWFGKCFFSCNQEAVHKVMTLTLFASKHFPKCRSNLRSGDLHSLS